MCACAAIICMGGCQSSAADSKKLTETQETQENETASGNVAEENMSDEEDTKEEEHGNGVFTGLENADEIEISDGNTAFAFYEDGEELVDSIQESE